jgi:diguanylate cyclase (GGDEF)-like protein/PAS domain S-box-containing protein
MSSHQTTAPQVGVDPALANNAPHAEAPSAQALPPEAVLAEAPSAQALPPEAVLAEAPSAQALPPEAVLAEAPPAQALPPEAVLAEAPPPGEPSPDVPPAKARLERVAKLFDMTSDLLAVISLDGHFELLNPAWEQLLGWSTEDLKAQPMQELVHPDDLEQTLALTLVGHHRAAQLANFTNRYRHRDGSWRWLLWSARCDGERWYAAAKDVTDRMWLERQALHDPLTKLPNRLLLMDRARQALTRLHRHRGGLVALLFIDLDRFKAINDNMGHAVGDHLLISVAERLAELLRDSDTVARLGGDEFVILAEDLESDSEALAVAERVLHALEEPFVVGSAGVSMLASVGVSVSHDPEADPEALLREADVAMYRAKSAGGRGLELFDESLRGEVTARLAIEERLRYALPRHELLVVYQPLLTFAGGRALGCEALVRWRPHDSELLEPSVFLPLAEESELIVQIGDWVLHTACAQAVVWREEGFDVGVSVNVSARELTEADLAARVREALAYHRLPASSLCLEASEDVVQRDPERAVAALQEVKSLGVVVALDNFGAGRSSFSLPGTLPLDVLKVSRELIHGFDRDKRKRAIVIGMIELARAAGLRAVAVGVETNRQLALARQLGCFAGQGFLLARPQAPERLALDQVGGALRSPPPWRPIVRLRGMSKH